MVFDDLFIGHENHLVGVDQILRQHQGSVVLHRQHPPQNGLHRAVPVIRVLTKINVIVPLSFHIALDFRLGGKEQKQKQSQHRSHRQELFHGNPP